MLPAGGATASPGFPFFLKDLAFLILLKFVSEVTAAEREMLLLPEDDDEEEEAGGREVMRVQRQIPFSQRERKAGCRNFFWKSYTSC